METEQSSSYLEISPLYCPLNSQLLREPRWMPLYSNSLEAVGLPVPILSNPTAHISRYIAAERTTQKTSATVSLSR
jgi:hypothetical protein